MEVDPHESHLRDLARLVSVPVPWFGLPHIDFIAKLDKIDSSRVLFQDYTNVHRRIVMGCVEKYRHRWDECFEK